MADPFEEFEFKPLTEGLGFHKKSMDLKKEFESTVTSDSAVARRVPNKTSINQAQAQDLAKKTKDLMQTLPGYGFTPNAADNKKKPVHEGPQMLHQPLPRGGEVAHRAEMIEDSSPMNEILATVNKDQSTAPKKTAAVVTEKRQGFHFGAFIFDSIAALGFASLFLASLVIATGLDLSQILVSLSEDAMAQIGGVVLFVSVAQMYLLTARTFFGCSLGEWAFDLELGSSKQQQNAAYPFRLLLRSLYIYLTGIIFLPLVSMILGRDIAGKWAGVELTYRPPYRDA